MKKLTCNSIRSIFNMIDEKEALEILKTYIDKDSVNRISNFIDLRGLASIVLWLINTFQLIFLALVLQKT